jgi:lipid-A-disaccharide synthase
VNVVAGREVAREFIQDQIVPAKIADVLQDLLDDKSPARRDVLVGLAEVRARLGTPGAAERVARMASGMVGDR